MLRFYTGGAGAGKTGRVMEQIGARVRQGRGALLIVPEQYSHEAERELCRVCGNALSLSAEALSFSGLARKLAPVRDGAVTLDKGGRLLCMAGELRASDFAPLDFELDFGGDERMPPLELGTGKEKLTLTGVADRVDGWVHEGKLYLRVVDYKTGRRKFDLSDVWYGMGLQMLLYLFALAENGSARYGREIVPAGVLYVPARDAMQLISEVRIVERIVMPP